MGVAFLGLAAICGLGALICFILVIVKMFTNDDATMGIICLVCLLCGIGGLIAYIRGWMKAGEWGITNIMLAWTGCFIGAIVFQGLAGAFANG